MQAEAGAPGVTERFHAGIMQVVGAARSEERRLGRVLSARLHRCAIGQAGIVPGLPKSNTALREQGRHYLLKKIMFSINMRFNLVIRLSCRWIAALVSLLR